MREAGILLPIFSLPSRRGIGSLGAEAREFIDFLSRCGQSVWQILPIGPTSFGDSPYQSPSAFAGNPYFISLDTLAEQGLLYPEELACYEEGTIDYGALFLERIDLLRRAWSRFDQKDERYRNFCRENQSWLRDYAVFMVHKEKNGYRSLDCWNTIPVGNGAETEEELSFWYFVQHQFYTQWDEMHAYAASRGVKILGDIPIYVSADSAEVLFSPENFLLDARHMPTLVAGCPPDDFAPAGQKWGNPLYNWARLRKDGYAFWVRRLAHAMRCFDMVRIDHFRGFCSFYAIPAAAPDARGGHWEDGPGLSLFEALRKALPQAKIIAEDLGFLDERVRKMLSEIGCPGMKVLQFAFDSREESDYLPHNYTANSIVYTGTHDNDTTIGWYSQLNRRDKKFAKKYLNIRTNKDVQWEFIRAAMASVSDTCVIPMQDYLGLGAEARINTPSTLGNNWKWRMLDGAFTDELAERIYEMTKLYGRLQKKK